MTSLHSARLWRGLTLATYFGLLGLLTIWTLWLTPSQQIAVVLVLYIGPLLIPLRGLLHGKVTTYAWTSLLVLFYFVAGVFELAGKDKTTALLAVFEIALSVLLFTATLAYVRYSGAEH